MRTWGWFVIVLIIAGLGTLIYALAGPPEREIGEAKDPSYSLPV